VGKSKSNEGKKANIKTRADAREHSQKINKHAITNIIALENI
jgi:hypothetical protein